MLMHWEILSVTNMQESLCNGEDPSHTHPPPPPLSSPQLSWDDPGWAVRVDICTGLLSRVIDEVFGDVSKDSGYRLKNPQLWVWRLKVGQGGGTCAKSWKYLPKALILWLHLSQCVLKELKGPSPSSPSGSVLGTGENLAQSVFSWNCLSKLSLCRFI